MKRVLSLTLACISVMTILCGTIALIGRLAPRNYSDIFPGLDTCGGDLCYWGIAPDVTSFEQARKILIAGPPQAEETYPNVFALPKFKTTTLLYLREPKLVEAIGIRPDATSEIVAGDMIGQLGPPCNVMSMESTLILRYEHLAIVLTRDAGGSAWSLSPYSHVTEIQLIAAAAKICLQPTDNRRFFEWRGFTIYKGVPIPRGAKK